MDRDHRPSTVPRRIPVLLLLASLTVPSAGAQTLRPPAVRQEFHRAERAWRTGTNLFEAKVRLDRVLEALPDDGPARLLRARVLLDLDRPAEALEDARAASDLQPGDGEAWLVRAEAAHRAEAPAGEATAALDRAAELITEGVEAHVRLSWTAQTLHQVDRAEAFARIALALGPDEPAAYWRLAEVFAEQGRPGDAATLVVRGLETGVLSIPDLRGHPALAPLEASEEVRRYLGQ